MTITNRLTLLLTGAAAGAVLTTASMLAGFR